MQSKFYKNQDSNIMAKYLQAFKFEPYIFYSKHLEISLEISHCYAIRSIKKKKFLKVDI